jgi:hypothetical protein
MLSLIKKTILSVAMLGCAVGMQAEDKKEIAAVETCNANGCGPCGKANKIDQAVAQFGLGTAAVAFGAVMMSNVKMVDARCLAYLGCYIPGICGMLIGSSYLLKHVKGGYNKLKAISAALCAATFPIAIGVGCSELVFNNYPSYPFAMLCGLVGIGAGMLSKTLQPEETENNA